MNRLLLLGLLLGVLLAVRMAAAQTRSPNATPVREADAVCGKCHAQILQSYLKTPMANASGLATEYFHAGSLRHQASGVNYQVVLDNGGASISYQLPGPLAKHGSERLEYSLGSGHLGLTYLYAKNNYWFESPIAYYASFDGYAMKPGLAKVTEMPPALTINPSCLRCHMSDVQPQENGTENRYQGLPFLHTGITCEGCHGDARAHIAAAGHSPVVNPIKLSPEKRDSTCIVCHLEGDTNVDRRGRAASEFRPSDDIRDYTSYFVFADADKTKRAVSEIEQFNSSQCKRSSGPSMSCMNCHDPHNSPSATERASYYRSKCLACHTEEKYRLKHYVANQDCTSCHMPKTGSENIAHVAWTDHRILQRPNRSEGADSVVHARDLVEVLSTTSQPRDLALAYYNLTVKGVAAERSRATSMVAAALKSDPDDEALLRAMGVLAEANGDWETAKKSYLALLKKDPSNLTAKTNLGTLLARSGDLEGALRLWTEVFQTNEDLPQLGTNLVVAACKLGDDKTARDALGRMYLYNPDLREVRLRFGEGQPGQDPCPTLSLQPIK